MVSPTIKLRQYAVVVEVAFLVLVGGVPTHIQDIRAFRLPGVGMRTELAARFTKHVYLL